MSGFPPHPVLLTLQTASDGPRGRAPVLQKIPLRIPLRENGGFDVGTAPLNVAVGQEGPQAAAKQLWAGNADQYSVLGRGLWKINIYMAEAAVEMRASEMGGEVWVKKWWQLFLQVWSWSGLAGRVAVSGKQADKCGLGELEALGKVWSWYPP